MYVTVACQMRFICVYVCVCVCVSELPASYGYVQLVKFLVAQADAFLANGCRDLLMLTNRQDARTSRALPRTHIETRYINT